ncbi:SRPBCC family protein [Paraflavisolibacter sp. H34]|uniref:SRPBCC family protein n=1 Tax=Huijunlia imazamoxiresistens TaxID=3127457 RepID=UPI00301B0494
MRIIKLAFFSFLVLFSLLTIFSLFIPSNIHLTKVIAIQGERDSIFALLQQKEQWPRWHPAFMPENDPQQQGLQQTRVVITGQTDTTLAVEMAAAGRKPLQTGWELHRADSTEPYNVVWYTDFHLSWAPWQKFSSLFFENTYGAMMEKGLTNLKKEVEGREGL